MSRRFVSEHAGEYPVTRLCQLVEVPGRVYAAHNRLHDLTTPCSRTRSSTSMSRRVAPTAHRACSASYATAVAVTAASGWRGSWPSAASSAPILVAGGACRDGKLFLAGIKDLHDQGLAGWSMGERNNTDLVVNALVMALARRAPDADLVHHADRRSNGGFNRLSQHLDVEVSHA